VALVFSSFSLSIHRFNAMSKPKVLIAFYSRNSSTEHLANAVAQGAASEGAEVRLRRAREFVARKSCAGARLGRTRSAMNAKYEAPTEADAEWADAIVFGTPTRFGSVAAELKAYIDSLGGLWFQGKLNGKAGSVFGSTSSQARRQRIDAAFALWADGAPRADHRSARLCRSRDVRGGNALWRDAHLPQGLGDALRRRPRGGNLSGPTRGAHSRALRVPQAVAETA
jgi:NAD(P)H-dependent FMN reductase